MESWDIQQDFETLKEDADREWSFQKLLASEKTKIKQLFPSQEDVEAYLSSVLLCIAVKMNDEEVQDFLLSHHRADPRLIICREYGPAHMGRPILGMGTAPYSAVLYSTVEDDRPSSRARVIRARAPSSAPARMRRRGFGRGTGPAGQRNRGRADRCYMVGGGLQPASVWTRRYRLRPRR